MRLPAELVAEVDRAARDELRSRSNLVRLFVLQGLERRESSDVEPREAS